MANSRDVRFATIVSRSNTFVSMAARSTWTFCTFILEGAALMLLSELPILFDYLASGEVYSTFNPATLCVAGNLA